MLDPHDGWERAGSDGGRMRSLRGMVAASVLVVVGFVAWALSGSSEDRDAALVVPTPTDTAGSPDPVRAVAPELTVERTPSERERYCWSDTVERICEIARVLIADGDAAGVAAEGGIGAVAVAGDGTAGVAAFDLQRLEPLWSAAFEGEPLTPPVMQGNRLVVLERGPPDSEGDVLRAFQADTGRSLWVTQLTFKTVPRPLVMDGPVLGVSGDTEAAVLDAASGEILGEHVGAGSVGGLAVTQRRSWYVATVCGTVRGSVLMSRGGWEVPGTHVIAHPDDEPIYTVGCGGSVAAWSFDGEQIWETRLDPSGFRRWVLPAVDERQVSAMDVINGDLWVLDAQTGQQLYRGQVPERSLLPFEAREGWLYVPGPDGLIAIRASDGMRTVLASFGSADVSDIALDRGHLVVGSPDGVLVVRTPVEAVPAG